ncbi:AAC(3) family N-acetyltransferase [Paenibacillus koleovorans]|uniref:AAC(3) family N-acetyltransferase n=1 Tax=Paenibacillus koleovorans TaxID=121608 RepID=UPI000FD99FC2|nr:AAC(3) family N-acetyltransferase [Paenibacillus koleovorans]
MNGADSLSKSALRDAIREAGLKDQALCVHASYRSFGRVEGGPAAVVEALLEFGNTVMVPAFTTALRVPPPTGVRLPERNGFDYSRREYDEHDSVYDPDAPDIDLASMGAVPAAVLRMPGRKRGGHPTNSFAAIGPLADDLLAGQTPADLWAPMAALVRLGGMAVLMGVGYDRLSLLHLAELQAGRRPFIRWVNDGAGGKREVSAGSCSLGFGRFEEALRLQVRRLQVGSSRWTLCPARATFAAAADALRADPHLTHCGDPACQRCHDMDLGGPI